VGEKKIYAAGGNRLVVTGQGECFASDDQMLARSTPCAARFNSSCIHCVGGKCIWYIQIGVGRSKHLLFFPYLLNASHELINLRTWASWYVYLRPKVLKPVRWEFHLNFICIK
jgi:hypothetical protein